jgi:hypothetical protein
MSSAFDAGRQFFQTRLEPFQCLRFDHGAHLREHPNQAPALLVIQFVVPHLPIHATRFRDDPAERMQGVSDERSLLLGTLFWGLRGGLCGFVFLRQAVDPFSLVKTVAGGS